jgi:hypothetical protein
MVSWPSQVPSHGTGERPRSSPPCIGASPFPSRTPYGVSATKCFSGQPNLRITAAATKYCSLATGKVLAANVQLEVGLCLHGSWQSLSEVRNARAEVTMPNRSVKSRGELEAMLIAELRKYPECGGVNAVAITRPPEKSCDVAIVCNGAQVQRECWKRVHEIHARFLCAIRF